MAAKPPVETADDFFSLATPGDAVIPCDLPGRNRSIYIRAVTGDERDGIQNAVAINEKTGKPNHPNLRAYLVSLFAAKENGDRLFNRNHIPQIGKFDGRVIEAIIEAGMRHNMLDDTAVDTAGNDFATDQTSDSGSDSPDT